MSIPRIIHFTIPSNASEEQLKNIDTARELHPGWEILVWQDPVDQAPFRLAKYWKKSNSGAQLADLIRLEVVFQRGGFYLDSDFVIQRSLEPLRMFEFVVASEDGAMLTNAFFGAVPQSAAAKKLIDELDGEEPDWTVPPYATTGPSLFTRELKWRDDVTVLPRESFYPYNFHERPTSPRLWTYGLHLWHHSWRTYGTEFTNRKRIRNTLARGKAHCIRFGRRVRSRMWRATSNLRRSFLGSPTQSYPASGVICAQTIHGPKIFLFGEDVTVTPEIALHGTYELQEERFINRVVRKGDWVIDVGANVGMLSLLCAQNVGAFGHVFSYEPNPLPASLLHRSLVMNWLHDRVSVREKALGSEPARMQLRFSKRILGGATLCVSEAAGTFNKSTALSKDEESVEVEVSTLDTEFPVDLPIRLLKIDAEGFEHHVLRGGSRLIEQHCIDLLMLECIQEVYGPNWNVYLSELKRIIGCGYLLCTLTRSGKLRPISFNQLLYSNRGRNIVLVSKHATNSIPELA